MTTAADPGSRVLSWLVEGDPTARLWVSHGVGEHAGRYEALGASLAGRGIEVFAYDQPGHGPGRGRAAHVDRWSEYVDDLEGRLSGNPAAPPLFVFGHSMGALVALTAAASRRGPACAVRGWVTSAAGIEPSGIARPHLVLIARALSRIVPRLSVKLGIEAADLSRDPEVVRAYEEDDLVIDRATVRWGAETLRAIAAIKARAGQIRQPLLVMHGESDRIADVAGSRWLAGAVSSPDVTLAVYPGGYHEPHNDVCRSRALSDLARWIEERAAA